MGQLIDEEDCEVCEVFDQEWIFTYGDLVTLLLCFFILLFSMCKVDTEKFKELAQSLRPAMSGTPFELDGKEAAIETIAQELEDSEFADEDSINVEERGVVVSFNAKAFFEPNSAELSEKAKTEMARFAKLLYLLPNAIDIEGHTDNQPPQGWSSYWELSGARASAVARQLIKEGIDGKKITVKGYGPNRPQFRNDSPQQRVLNNRVEVVIVPQ